MTSPSSLSSGNEAVSCMDGKLRDQRACPQPLCDPHREGEGSYDGSAVGNAGAGGTPNTNPKGNGKGKTKTKTNKGETKVPKKEKTEDQLARAVPLH